MKFENTEVFNFRGALTGMRNPKNSWDKSDSCYDDTGSYKIGEADMKLAQQLIKAGSEHRKFLRQIFVTTDITAPLYWIAELDTYKVGTTRNSCSFMHKGLSKPFEITDFSVHDEKIYEILGRSKEKEYKLKYPYETDEYKVYACENGRKYKVYKNGKIVSEKHEYVDSKGRHRIFEETECKPSCNPAGYFYLHLGGRNGEKWLIHRLIATVWLDNPDLLDTVNHINGDKGDNSVENLEWRSRKDNIIMGFQSGLYNNLSSLSCKYKAWKNGHKIVDPLIKQHIKFQYKHYKTIKELTEEYDYLTYSQIINILFAKECDDSELFRSCYIWEEIINQLNYLRDVYLDTRDEKVFQMIRCLLPSGYLQKFTWTCNYENLLAICSKDQRRNHKLTEWSESFINWARSLPYAQELIFIDEVYG